MEEKPLGRLRLARHEAAVEGQDRGEQADRGFHGLLYLLPPGLEGSGSHGTEEAACQRFYPIEMPWQAGE